jgi:hypothetical protein
MLPETFPAALGVKSTLKFALWPGFRVRGRIRPVMLKLALLTDACETVTADPPPFVRVTLCV